MRLTICASACVILILKISKTFCLTYPTWQQLILRFPTSMDCFDLHVKIDYLSPCGIVLTPEQKASLQTSLTLLKYEQKHVIVNFWGIIKGVQGDYYIAQGIGKDYMNDVTTLYSKDCINWCLLPIPTKHDIETSKYFKMRFTGDPQNEFEHSELKQYFKGDELIQEEIQVGNQL